MKKVIVLCIMFCATMSIWAQTVSDVRTAAERGDAEAQFVLGMFYHNGYQVSQSNTEALKWFRKSAEKDFPPAQVYLGAFYYAGIEVEQNNTTALYWCEKAYKKWETMSKEMRDMLTQQGLDKTYLENIINELKPSSTIPKSQTPTGKFEKVWLEHNVYKNGKYGMNIHIHFTVNNMKGKNPVLCAFVTDNYDENIATQCSGGSASPSIIPPYDNTEYNDYIIFKSYNDFKPLPSGKTDLKLQVRLIGESLSQLDISDYVYFTFTK